MYTASTYERAPRRHLALVMSAAALVVTLAAAWGLRQMRFAPAPLEKPISLPGWPISFRLPEGYTALDDPSEKSRRGEWRDTITFQSPVHKGRSLTLTFAYNSIDRGATPRMAAMHFLAESLGAGPQVEGDAEPEPLSMAGQYGCVVDLSAQSPLDRRFFRCAAVCLPNGRSIVVMLGGPGLPTASELSVHRSVCASVEFKRSPFADDLNLVTQRCGLRCEIPTGGRIVHQADAAWPIISLTASAAASHAWHVEVLPTFLTAERTIERLMQNYLVMNTYTLRPDMPIETTTTAGHAVARVELTNRIRTMDVRFIDLGERRAAFLVGYTDPSNAGGLASDCEKIAATLTVDPSHWPFDVDQAEKTAARLLDDVSRRGLPSLVKPFDSVVAWTRELAGEYYGLERVRRLPPDENNKWLRGESRIYCNPRGDGFEGVRRWTIDPLARAFQSNEDLSMRLQGRPRPIKTELQRDKPTGSLRYEVHIDEQTYEARFDVPTNYLPDPIIDAVIGSLAVQSKPAPAIFRVVTLSDRDLSGVYVGPLPGAPAEKNETAPIVQIADFEPVPAIRWFDRNGILSREEHGPISRLRRVRPGKLPESTPAWLRRLLDTLTDTPKDPPSED